MHISEPSQTQNKIQNLFDKLDPKTSTVFVNALYLKAQWNRSFEVTQTQPVFFRSSLHQATKVKMMNQTSSFNYYEDETSQWIELPYLNSTLSMILALPKKQLDLRAVEDKLSSDALATVIKNWTTQKVDLKLPQFKFSKYLDLTQTFMDAGYEDLFKNADYSRYQSSAGKQKLLTRIIQATTIEVNESGTEAAASTAVMMAEASLKLNLGNPKKFYADQPFLFMIRNMQSGEIYFLGRVYDPAESN